MQGRSWGLVAVALAIAVFAVIIANAYFSGVQQRNAQAAERQQTTKIVVASQPLEFGTAVTAQNIALHDWPEASVPAEAFHSIDEILTEGRVALRPVVAGEPLLASKLSGKNGRATLAAVLPDGLRAVSVPVNPTTGVSGFVLPGTLVDVILTRPIGEDIRSDVILQNAQVLAVDQGADEKDGEPKVAKNATLAVSLRDAQRLAVAGQMGTLSLALRKLDDAAGAAQPDEGATLLALAGPVTGRDVTGGRAASAPAEQRAPRAPARRLAKQTGAAASAADRPALMAANMTIFRGTQPTEYSVGRLGGQ